MGWEGIVAMAAGVLLLGLGVLALRPSAAGNTFRRGRGALCRLGGCGLFVLGFLFWSCPQDWSSLLLACFAGFILLLLLLHRLLWTD